MNLYVLKQIVCIYIFIYILGGGRGCGYRYEATIEIMHTGAGCYWHAFILSIKRINFYINSHFKKRNNLSKLKNNYEHFG